MPELLSLLLTDAERDDIQMKLARRRPITLTEVRRLLEHIELLEQLTLLQAPKAQPEATVCPCQASDASAERA